MTIKGIVKIVTFGSAGFLASCSSTSVPALGQAKVKGASPNSQDVLQKLDADNDGFLSYQEFQLRQKKAGTQGGRKSLGNFSSDEMKQKRFAAIDTNSDQRISAAELAAAPRPTKRRR